MEPSRLVSLRSSGQVVPPQLTQNQRYCNLNPSELAESARFKEKLHKIASIVVMIAAGILLVGAVTTAAVLLAPVLGVGAALVSSLILVAGVSIYRHLIYDKGIVLLKSMSAEYGVEAAKNEGIAKMARKARSQLPDLTKGEENLLGRMRYWESVASENQTKRQSLNLEITSLRAQIEAKKESASREELKVQEAQLSAKLREKYRLNATELLPAKVKAAYFHHIIQNFNEMREFTDFGQLKPPSYLQQLEMKNPVFFFTTIEGEKSNWTMEELHGMDFRQISQEIFSKATKAA